MKVLIVGSGAREHAIGEKILLNETVEKLYFAPGNAGTSKIGKNVSIAANEIDELLKYAISEGIDYTIVGPEVPLCLGIVDKFEEKGLRIFGPSEGAAQLEGSKSFTKEFLVKYNIPTAAYIKSTDFDEALEFAKKLLDKNGIVVIKADGLCEGKGVFITTTVAETKKYLDDIFNKGLYGEKMVVVEEFLDGFEMSLIAFVDNYTIKMLPTSKDHKKIWDGEVGLNTGGMGTFSPNVEAIPYLDEIEDLVLAPFLRGINEEKLDFRGIIFIGLMIGSNGIKVLEFNTRFGDPETQSILNRLETDLLNIMQAVTDEKLNEIEIVTNDKKVVTLVLASGGYPEEFVKGYEISGLDDVDGIHVYHAGTTLKDGKVVTNGGRVMSLTATADSFEEAIAKVYNEAEKIVYSDKYFRKDIGPMIKRYYVEKKEEYRDAAHSLRSSIKDELGFDPGETRIILRYDIEGLSDSEASSIENTILSEPPIDDLYTGEDATTLESNMSNPLVVEFHSGQFEQRKQSLLDTIAVSLGLMDVEAKCATVYSFENELSPEEINKIENYLINPVDQVKGKLFGIPTKLKEEYEEKHKNIVYEGFINLDEKALEEFKSSKGLAMSYEDLKFIQDHFKSINRDINETELAILDTYWSDHCRHTTFNTILDIEFDEMDSPTDKKLKDEFEAYISMREGLNRKKPISLMDLGTIVAKYLKTHGKLDDLEESDEINACSIRVKVKVGDYETGDVRDEKYLLMFKNETHNHPTEIEPFGGASTCLGGAIRDPLSGRSYVYQAMRVTGSGDPRQRYEDTLPGKLPQKKITTEAANGYSSYGNQIGLATGLVDEIYHDSYVAKRMEVGALVGAAPEENVVREQPVEGDVIILIGGKTGRDGIGGATGSSREQTEQSIVEASAEVQKGNAPTERNIQRLFRDENVTKMIKKCNDFGAGGVSVAIGELADSLEIYLDRVPLKYQGLSPREIAISESQERMAAVVSASDADKFIEYCHNENLEATVVAKVTNSGKMIMLDNDEIIAELDREFLDTSGVDRYQNVLVKQSEPISYFDKKENDVNTIFEKLKDINYVSKKNLIQKFDFSVGRGTVLSPLGGKYQLTPIQTMVAAIPSLKGNSKTVSLMSYGFDPYLSEENQFLGGYYAVIESLTKIAAVGGNALSTRLSFQEYFESMGTNQEKWSKPLRSLLGAFYATRNLNVPPIGGKDSMSGTFKDIDVPPTLISFAVTTEDIENIISPELKGGYKLGIIKPTVKDDFTLDHEDFINKLNLLYDAIKSENVKSAYSLNSKGLLHSLMEMSLGNQIGFRIESGELFDVLLGSIVVEYEEDADFIENIGVSGGDQVVINGEVFDTHKFKDAYLGELSSVFSGEVKYEGDVAENTGVVERNLKSRKLVDEVKVLIVAFPGTNSEYDTEEAFRENSATVETFVFGNKDIKHLNESIEKLSNKIKEAQIFVIPGGFSFGDEPDGSGKFIATVLRNEKIKNALEYMQSENDGLILGICNGFQALVKSGLLPGGVIREMDEKDPTLTFNTAGRHIARFVDTKMLTTNSPWLKFTELDKTYILPISHGEGRFVVSEEVYETLSKGEQIAAVYCDVPNGSEYAIEALISPDGKILGKMGHSERFKDGLFKNIPDLDLQPIIKAGVDYFKK